MTTKMKSLATRVRRNVRGRMTGVWLDEAKYEFIDYNRRKWGRRSTKPSRRVILIGLFTHPPAICACSYAGNFLADKADASMECYWFNRGNSGYVEPLYESFGARLTLGWAQAEKYRAEAEKFAEQTWSGLTCKEDILKISIRDLVLGDLIHDTYLRMEFLTQADLRDTRLRDYIRDAYMMLGAFEEYFDTHEVMAVLPHDPGFLECSIPQRLALQRGIPQYFIPYAPLTLMRLDEEFQPGDVHDHRNWPCKGRSHTHFPERFAAFPESDRKAAIEKAREKLNAYLGGKINPILIPSGNSAYAPTRAERLLSTSDKPKMIILLHDMCDCPNAYRWMLFPDFYEWIHFLLSRAVQTPFEWYVKPHPHNSSHPGLNKVNRELFEELQRAYPTVTFLNQDASNRQIIDEGITALFTVFGSATAEFAYLGLPAVTAGDHACIDYGFNINARTLEQYEKLIFNADRLEVKINKEEIEEFYYMWNLQFRQPGPDRVSMIPEEWIESPQRFELEPSSETYRRFVRDASPERDAKVQRYFERSLAEQRADPFLRNSFPPVSSTTALNPSPC